MQITDLDDLFVHKLAQLYYVENELVGALDEMAMTATNDRLSRGFADHRDETRGQIERLERVFSAIDRPAEEREDPVLDALEAERHEMENAIDDEDLLNTVYLGAGMMTERIEMTAYESLTTMARQLELGDDVTDPLQQNYDEEKSAYRELDAMSTASDMKALWDRLTPGD